MNEKFTLSRRTEQKPYVVSGDIKLALKPWAERNGFILPNDSFFQDLRGNFSSYMKSILPSFEFIEESTLTVGIASITEESSFPIVSLDPLYLNTENQLMMTRTVDDTRTDRGLRRRDNSPSLLRQIRRLNQFQGQQIALFDDVGFSGEMLIRLTNILSRMGIAVPMVYLGVGIGEALEKLEEAGIAVQTIKSYQDVVDEICERDFYPGVPQSGRTYADNPTKGFPYILPFGDPVKWASIPSEKAQELSVFCLQQSIELFEEIESQSNRIVRCCDIEKKIVRMPEGNERFVDELRKYQRQLLDQNANKI